MLDDRARLLRCASLPGDNLRLGFGNHVLLLMARWNRKSKSSLSVCLILYGTLEADVIEAEGSGGGRGIGGRGKMDSMNGSGVSLQSGCTGSSP